MDMGNRHTRLSLNTPLESILLAGPCALRAHLTCVHAWWRKLSLDPRTDEGYPYHCG